MNALVTLNGGEAVTTTLAIAEGTELDHASVILLVRKYLDDIKEFGLVDFKSESTGGRPTEYATLNEQQATLIMTYMRNSDIVRGFKKRLVKAFWELAKQPQHLIPQSLPEALRLAADLADQKAKVEAQLAIAAPKLEVYDLIIATDETLNMTEAAKVLQTPRDKLKNILVANKWLYKRAGSKNWLGFADKVQQGLIIHKMNPYIDQNTGEQHMGEQPRFTGKGLARLAQLLGIQPPQMGGAA